jgi:hypothetical protein
MPFAANEKLLTSKKNRRVDPRNIMLLFLGKSLLAKKAI